MAMFPINYSTNLSRAVGLEVGNEILAVLRLLKPSKELLQLNEELSKLQRELRKLLNNGPNESNKEVKKHTEELEMLNNTFLEAPRC